MKSSRDRGNKVENNNNNDKDESNLWRRSLARKHHPQQITRPVPITSPPGRRRPNLRHDISESIQRDVESERTEGEKEIMAGDRIDGICEQLARYNVVEIDSTRDTSSSSSQKPAELHRNMVDETRKDIQGNAGAGRSSNSFTAAEIQRNQLVQIRNEMQRNAGAAGSYSLAELQRNRYEETMRRNNNAGSSGRHAVERMGTEGRYAVQGYGAGGTFSNYQYYAPLHTPTHYEDRQETWRSGIGSASNLQARGHLHQGIYYEERPTTAGRSMRMDSYDGRLPNELASNQVTEVSRNESGLVVDNRELDGKDEKKTERQHSRFTKLFEKLKKQRQESGVAEETTQVQRFVKGAERRAKMSRYLIRCEREQREHGR